MTLTETLVLITMIMTVLMAAGVLYLVFRRNDDAVAGELEKMRDSLGKRMDAVNKDLTKQMYESIADFNEKVSVKLGENAEKTGRTIAEFRINVNEQLSRFQDKMNEAMEKDFKALATSIDSKMAAINEKVENRLTKGFRDTNETFVKIAERVKVIDTAQKKIEELSTEMVGLQNILSSNQERGAFGEFQLNQLLFSVFGENKKLYDIQHTIKKTNGKQDYVRADAVVFMPEPHNMIAVDSKFPFSTYARLFENNDLDQGEKKNLISQFGREVKKHITSIADKYIIAGVTAEYALMFVPSDGILSFLHTHLENVITYAREKYVTIVSPTTLIPLMSSLHTVMLDYERSAHMDDIGKQLGKLKKDFDKLAGSWQTLNNSIARLGSQSEHVNDRVGKITSRFKEIHKLDFLSGRDHSRGEDG